MKYYFADNQEYNSEDLKTALGITVATGGIAIDLNDGESYNPSALNRLIGSAVCEGVLPGNSSFRVDKANGGYIVNPGKAVFSDGGIAILENAEAVDAKTGQYIALTYSFSAGAAINVSGEKFTEDGGLYVVPLAKIMADGSVEDMREFAKGRVPALASAEWNTLHRETFSVTFPSGGGGFYEAPLDFGGSFNFMLFDRHSCISMAFIDGSAVTYHSVYRFTSQETGNKTDRLMLESTTNSFLTATVINDAGKIKLRFAYPSELAGKTRSFTLLVGIIAK